MQSYLISPFFSYVLQFAAWSINNFVLSALFTCLKFASIIFAFLVPWDFYATVITNTPISRRGSFIFSQLGGFQPEPERAAPVAPAEPSVEPVVPTENVAATQVSASQSIVDDILDEDDDAVVARRALDKIRSQAGISSLDSFYTFKFAHLIENSSGGSRLRQYSPFQLLSMAYPTHPWMPWQFTVMPRGYFRSHENRKVFFDWLGRHLKLPLQSGLSAWYSVSADAIQSNGGSKILKEFEGSLAFALMDTYPDHQWSPWRFRGTSMKIWEVPLFAKQFFQSLQKDLKVR